MLTDTTTIGSIVADDFRAAAVFDRHGIDFCCGGSRLVFDACRERGVAPETLVADLEAALAEAGADVPRFNDWALDFLTGYIVANHHGYVREAIDTLRARTRKLVEVHGERHAELRAIADRFEALAADLTGHMAREEQVLFPYVNGLVGADRGGIMPSAHFGTVENPVRVMETEHQAAGEVLAAIRRLTGGYVPPSDACATYTVTYQELQAFEADLHRHVHLENNILFPRVTQMIGRQTP